MPYSALRLPRQEDYKVNVVDDTSTLEKIKRFIDDYDSINGLSVKEERIGRISNILEAFSQISVTKSISVFENNYFDITNKLAEIKVKEGYRARTEAPKFNIFKILGQGVIHDEVRTPHVPISSVIKPIRLSRSKFQVP